MEGVKTTIPLHQRILEDDYYRTGNIDTQFIKNRLHVYESMPPKKHSLKELQQYAKNADDMMYYIN